MAASKTWKKLKFASKFGNKAELAKVKVEEEEQDCLYKIVKEPDPKFKNIIREYSQNKSMHLISQELYMGADFGPALKLQG